jgi:hypothetical protein
MARGPSTFRQTDLRRAYKEATAAGLKVVRAEIHQDGGIVLLTGEAAEERSDLAASRNRGERPLRPAAISATPTLRVEHSMTADMPDGQPLAPPCDCGPVWHVVRRDDSRTLWRRISLPSATDSRSVPGVLYDR